MNKTQVVCHQLCVCLDVLPWVPGRPLNLSVSYPCALSCSYSTIWNNSYTSNSTTLSEKEQCKEKSLVRKFPEATWLSTISAQRNLLLILVYAWMGYTFPWLLPWRCVGFPELQQSDCDVTRAHLSPYEIILNILNLWLSPSNYFKNVQPLYSQYFCHFPLTPLFMRLY